MKKRISLLLAITMLLSGCNTAEKTEQTTVEKTTTAETTAVTTTTKVTTTTTEKQISAHLKETEITQTTKNTPITPKSEVYLFDYHSLDEIAPSEKEQFEIFENVFYGEWESDRISNDKFFTYRNCYFDFAGACSPVCFTEIDEGYVLPYIHGGVLECFFIKKDNLSVMYNPHYDFIIGGITIDENTTEYHKESYSYSKEISEGKLSSLGQMKLNSIIGGNFEECLNSTLADNPIFTDIDGTEWIYSLGDMGIPVEERYLVSYSEDKVELGIRHFKKSEYDAYIDGDYSIEPEERYFVLAFEKYNDEWILAADLQIQKITPIYDGTNGEVFYLEDADISQEPFYAYHFTYVHTGGEIFRINEGDEYGDYSIRSARRIFYPYEDEFVEWGGSYQFDDTVTLNGKLETFKYMGEDEPELFLTITVDENPGFPFPYYIYDDYPFQEILINLGKPEKYSDNDEVMDFVKNKDVHSEEKFSVTLSYLCIAWVDSNRNQSSGYIESINDIIDM